MPSEPIQNHAGESPSALRRLWTVLRPYGRKMAGVVLLLGVLALTNTALPAFIALLFNEVFPNRAWTLLGLILLGIVAVYLVRNLLYFGSKFTSVWVGEQVCFNLRRRLFERLQSRSLVDNQRQRPGEVSSRVMDDSFVVQTFIQDHLPKLLQSLCLFVALVAILYAVNWKLALASTIVLPFHLYASRRFRRPIQRAAHDAQTHLAMVHGNLIEKFLGAEVVKGFAAEQRESDSFVRAIDTSRRSQLASKKYLVTQKIVSDLLVGLGTVALLGYGGYQVMQGTMRPGTFIAFFGYVGMLYPTVAETVNGLAKLTKTGASLDRVFELLESGGAEAAPAQTRIEPIRGHVQFESVRFAYEDGALILNDLTLDVPAGGVCVITGPSGAGKSTLLSLLPRFNTPASGRVLIDGADASELNLKYLRDSIGIAFQECFLFNASILENLRYARPDASFTQIVRAAKRTSAHDFITRLPDGYDTLIGASGGLGLSRGEKQLIALTRAILKNPQILILDEATASIDMATASRVMPEILRFMQGRTTLIVTHRTDLMALADKIVRIEEGQVVYEGPALEALAAPDAYESRAAMGDVLERIGDGAIRKAQAWLIAGLIGLGALLGGSNAAHAADPAPTSRFLPQTGLVETEVRDLIEVLTAKAVAEMGYTPIAAPDNLPTLPGLMRRAVLVRATPDGRRVLQVGYRTFRSQPPHVWLHGQRDTEQGAVPNEDLATLEKILADVNRTRVAQIAASARHGLRIGRIPLSYVEPERCLSILTQLGYATAKPNAKIDTAQLPVVTSLLVSKQTGLVDLKQTAATTAGPETELMVYYHPARPEQFSRLLDRVKSSIDVPADQIVIEAMVLEIFENGLEKLGIEWELQPIDGDNAFGNINNLMLGRLPAFDANDDEKATLSLEVKDVFGHFKANIQALIRNGDAEVMARPSILTLDNRQAAIHVGERIPIATAATGLAGSDKFAFQFRYEDVGIDLNVRPRVSSDRRWISMQIHGQVSAEVPGEDIVILDNAGNELARAPRISTRRVQTYGRIGNNTPFIIGGLVARDKFDQVDKVPLLGDLPLLGGLFRVNRNAAAKREVIIVLTPYVLPRATGIGRNLPKDEDAFDSFGNKLFRNAYRIRAEDVYDLTFLFQNRYLNRMRSLADEAIRRDFRLAERMPFSLFTEGRVPGEQILVYRQMYEVIKRLELDAKVHDDRIIFFRPDDRWASGFSVTFLDRYLRERLGLRDSEPIERIFDTLAAKGRALALTYPPDQKELQAVLKQPVPELELVECPDDQAWANLLWQRNQPDAQGRRHHTILIRSADDLVRLKRAVLLKRTVQLNSNPQTLSLDNFSVGRQLLMPDTNEEKVYVVDGDTARYFFLTEHYYPALGQTLNRRLDDLRDALRAPAVRELLDGAELPEAQPIQLPARAPTAP